MAAQNQAAHAAAISAAGGTLIQAVNAAKDDGLEVDLALRILARAHGPDVVPANVGRLQVNEVFVAIGSGSGTVS